MDRLQARFSVSFDFPVVFTRGAFAPANDTLAGILAPTPGQGGPVRILAYLDQGLAAARPALAGEIAAWFAARPGFELAAPPRTVPGGEAAKRALALVEGIAEDCTRHRLCRHSWILVAGGGAVLDAVGFAAALVHRGLRLLRLPSTSLAQADGGLGVKNAVNLLGQKNLLGTFMPPRAVVDDLDLLDALDDRAWRAGFAEAVKVAAIRDAGFARELAGLAAPLAARDRAAQERIVRRCAALHLAHITGGGDPFEQGSSRPLDFGHWSAHRLEMLSGHRLGHGEAVAIGVALDLFAAAAMGRIADADALLLVRALARAGFALWDPTLEQRDPDGRPAVWAGLEQFREHLGGALTLAMPDGLGRSRDVDGIDEAVFAGACARLRALALEAGGRAG